MTSTWLLVADEYRARLFEYSTPDHRLKELADLVHPASRLKETDLGSDEPGTSFHGHSAGSHSVSGRKSLKHVEAERFAREVAGKLAEDYQHRRFDRLAILASPRFLGLLRPLLTKSLQKSIVLEIDKEVSNLSISGIREHLPQNF